MRYDGLERDITYTKYVELRQSIIKRLLDDDSNLDDVLIYVNVLKTTRDTLDRIKEYRDGRTEV